MYSLSYEENEKRNIALSRKNTFMPESDVLRLKRQIDNEYETAQRGLHGLASGTARHDFIQARAEQGGKQILQLLAEGKQEQAFQLWSSPTWGQEELQTEEQSRHTVPHEEII